MINTRQDNFGGWEVWQDYEDDAYNGVCLGSGESQMEAMLKAQDELIKDLKTIESLISGGTSST